MDVTSSAYSLARFHSMAPFDVTAAQIVALFMESVFYGIYLVTFFSCMRVLLWKDGHFKRWDSINKIMTLAAVLMLVFGTLDVAFGLRHNLDAFVYAAAKGIGPAEEFAHISYWLNVMKFANYSAQTFIGDGILLYRCYVIFDQNWAVLAAPVLMWIGTAVCSAFTIYIEAHMETGGLIQSQFHPFITSTLCLTLATNVITTSLIVYRIYAIHSRTANQASRTTGLRSSPYSNVLRTLLECGAMYTASVLVLFACYLANNNAILGVSDSVVQIIGITFNLLILSVDRGVAAQPHAVSLNSYNNNYINTIRSEIDTRQTHAVPLHQLRIKTVTSTTRDPPEDYFDPLDKEVPTDSSLDSEGNQQKVHSSDGQWRNV